GQGSSEEWMARAALIAAKQRGIARKRQSREPDPLAAVEAQLEAYAERGVFRSFSRTSLKAGIAEFRFFWLLNLPFRMTFDSKRGVLAFPKLLPKVPAASELNTALKEFVENCSAEDRPEHRRLDPLRLRTRCSNRAGSATLTIECLDGDFETAVKKAILLVNEVFLSFLNVRHPEYMIETFRLPDE
ncbi:MAG: hypothetical protein ABI823_18540, partial [Bryobacteraceae bacterium]